MKRIIWLLLSVILLIPLGCANRQKQLPDDRYMCSVCNKDSVDELISIIGEVELGGLSTGMRLDAEHCYNVTPPDVADQTDIKIFKFSDSCVTLALIDGKVYQICASFGGFGFANAVPWDYDSDGNLDLLIASSWGSGMHRSEITVFNTVTKESIMVYDTAKTQTPGVDLIVAEGVALYSSKDPRELPVEYLIYSVDVAVHNDNLADLSYSNAKLVGSVIVKDGVPAFQPV